MNVRKSVRPHPSTVTAASTGEVPSKRRRRSAESGRTSRVSTRHMLDGMPEVARATVLRLADGDLSRVEVVSPTEVVVRNPGWRSRT